MKQLNVRLPDELHAQVKTIAAADNRSINSELIVLLTEAIKERERRS